jgi:hypothetical protein
VIVLRTSATLHCDRCEALVVRSERGWRAYVRRNDGGKKPAVEVVCPACAEQLFGEDEVEARSARRTT